MAEIHKSLYLKMPIFNQIILTFIINFSICHYMCEIDTPIYKNGTCQLIYCSEIEFKEGICSIENEVIKTQWLNNIILFNDRKYRYGSLAINSKGDLIVEFSTEENNGIRLFYGLKQNGNFFFKNSENSGISTKIIKLNYGEEALMRYESENIFITVDNKNEEYLISISLYFGYVELYDFQTNNQSFVKTENFTGYNIYTSRSQLIEITSSENKKEYLHVFVGQNKDDLLYKNFYLVLHKYNFSNSIIGLNDGYNIIKSEIKNKIFGSRTVSAYTTDSNLIILFYFNNKAFFISIYDNNLNEKNNTIIESNIANPNGNIGIFFKCFYLKNNLGVFIYFKGQNDYAPQVKIEEIENDFIKEKMNISLLSIEFRFNVEPMLSDSIKINNNRFSFITSSYDKSQLFILLFDLYNNDNNIKIRLYKIYLLDLYNFHLFREVKSILYNNYLTISLSVCYSLQCRNTTSDDNNNYFSMLIIFSYINGTDTFIDLYPYLQENKNENGNDDNIIEKLLENAKIDNNIFGYEILKQIKLIKVPPELELYNIANGLKIYVSENDNLVYNHEIIQKQNMEKKRNDTYFIEYQFIVQEQEYDKFNEYPVKIIDYPENSTTDQSSEFKKNKFFSKINRVKFKLCNDLCETCKYLGSSKNTNCTICISNYEKDESGNCILLFNETDEISEEKQNIKTENENTYTYTYAYSSQIENITNEKIEETVNKNTYEDLEICEKNMKYYIEKKTNEKICLKNEDNCPLDYPFLNNTNNQCMEKISFEELLNYNFSSYNATEENEILYNLFKTTIIENYSGKENFVVMSQDSNIFQLTNTLNELNTKKGINTNNFNLSMIDLGDCGKELKKKYNLDEDTPLLLFKLEKSGEIASKKNIQYEVYNPNTKEKMDLSICDDEKIDIYIPVNLSEEKKELQNDLLNYGYDLFNPNDSFYQDICSTYTSKNGTDVLLSDRRKYFFNDTETSCQEGCQYSEYSQLSGNLKCECIVINKNIETNSINKNFDEKIIFTSFYDVIKFSNYKLFKCYKIVFNLNKLKNNYGSYIFIFYFIMFLIFNFAFYIKGFYYIRVYAAKMLYNELDKNKNNLNENIRTIRKNKIYRHKKPKNIFTPPRKSVCSVIEINKSNSEKINIINQNFKNMNKEIKILKRNKTKSRNSVLLINKKGGSITESNTSHKLNSKLEKYDKKKINKKNRISIFKISNNIKIEKSQKKQNIFSLFKGNNFSDFELNELDYKKAIKYDNRSFFRYYWSLIRREHLIFFTFFSFDDYNILSIKLSKCIFAMATDFALNVLFFFDESMSKIYLDYGKYDFIAQIPQALYSTIVSEALDILLRYLGLTEKDIYQIKKIEKNNKIKSRNNQIFKILKLRKLKLSIYFILSHILFFIFWYFVSAFCAVYKNTQIILFKDSFLSLFLSLLYPFGLYLIPTTLRIIALRNPEKNLICLYKSSDLIPLI